MPAKKTMGPDPEYPMEDQMEYEEEDGEGLDPQHEAIAELMATDYETSLDRAEAALKLSESAEDPEEERTLINLAKLYAALHAAARPKRNAADSTAFESIYKQLENDPACKIAKRAMAIEDSVAADENSRTKSDGDEEWIMPPSPTSTGI